MSPQKNWGELTHLNDSWDVHHQVVVLSSGIPNVAMEHHIFSSVNRRDPSIFMACFPGSYLKKIWAQQIAESYVQFETIPKS